MMNELSKKRQQFAKEVRFNNRQDIKNKIREKTFMKNNIQRPIMSDSLGKYIDCTHFELMDLIEQMQQTIIDTDIQALDDDEHESFVTDLFYLLHEHMLQVPPNISFKKNESIYTASFVAMASNSIDEQEIVYWIRYMSDEDKSMMFMSISPFEPSHTKWVQNRALFIELVNHVKFSYEAALSFKELLTQSDCLQKKHIDESIPYIQNALSYNDNTQDLDLKRQIFSIWLHILTIYSKITIHRQETKQMMQVLKIYINKSIGLLIDNQVLTGVNSLWETITEDLISVSKGEQLMEMVVSGGYDNIKKQEVELFKGYLCRFFYNNWRMKQLFSKPFAYSQNFYKSLQKLIHQTSNNPFYQKLLSIKQKP